MSRLRDHLTHLNRVVEDNRLRHHAYGDWDCCVLAADAVLAVTGVDHMEAFRGRYSDLRGAVALLRELGHGTLCDTTAFMLGEPISPLRAWRGDIVHHESNLGVCMGANACFITDWGLQPTPMSVIKTVFGVR